jgi:hypothetical protein
VNGFLASEPFDADELLRWAEMYGDPEEWAQKAKALHTRMESLQATVRNIRDELTHGSTANWELIDRWFDEVLR